MKVQDYEVANAQLLLSQQWSELESAFDALFQFFGAPVEDEFKDSHLVRCDRCSKPLYRVRDMSVVILTPREQEWARAITIRPVVLTVANRVRLVLCSRQCAIVSLHEATDRELLGGYPL